MNEQRAQWMDRLSTLVLDLGVALRPGQVLLVEAGPEHQELTRNLAAHAYRRGARYVDVSTFDPWVQRERILHSREATLDWYPEWRAHRVVAGAASGAAIFGFSSADDPALADGVDPERAAQEPGDILPETMELIGRCALPWCLAPGPTRSWAQRLRPEHPAEEAYNLLWRDVATVCRLDDEDPVASWRSVAEGLTRRCAVANEARWDRLRFRGPGTDLEVGLLPGSRWACSAEATPDGHAYYANLPSEEIYTAPDPLRVEGHARLRKPRAMAGGGRIEEMTMRFEQGRVVDVTGSGDVAMFLAQIDSDDGGRRLGEVALVAGNPPAARVEPLGLTVVEENAGCHVAVGTHFPSTLDADHERGNRSAIHLDLVIGAPDVEVVAVAADGSERTLISDDRWLI